MKDIQETNVHGDDGVYCVVIHINGIFVLFPCFQNEKNRSILLIENLSFEYKRRKFVALVTSSLIMLCLKYKIFLSPSNTNVFFSCFPPPQYSKKLFFLVFQYPCRPVRQTTTRSCAHSRSGRCTVLWCSSSTHTPSAIRRCASTRSRRRWLLSAEPIRARRLTPRTT